MADSDAAWDWPLPDQPHIPGRTPRPPGDDDVHRIASAAPDPTVPQAWRDNAAYMAGFRLYAAGCFWEAHEVWEPVWMKARPNSRERELVQGLIQLANAGLKIRMGQPNAARRLATFAARRFREAAYGSATDCMGIEPEALAKLAEVLTERLTRENAPPIPEIPLAR